MGSLDKNRSIYNKLWGAARLLEAHNFNTWPLVKSLLPQHRRRLEVAPGLRPRLPVEDTTFVDISSEALNVLERSGGQTREASICNLPFNDGAFDLVCALDIIEHVEDDDKAISELARVASNDAVLLISTPLYQQFWSEFDSFVGHCRRYEPCDFLALIHKYGFIVERSAVFGMKPKSSIIVRLGMWFLKHNPRRAMWWYNRVLPIVARRQKPLNLVTGVLALKDVGEIFLVCRKRASVT